MIVVRIELVSARTGRISEIGRMYIANDETGDARRSNYDAKVCRRGSFDYDGWENVRATREGRVENYPSAAYNVWRLVIRALKSAFPEER